MARFLVFFIKETNVKRHYASLSKTAFVCSAQLLKELNNLNASLCHRKTYSGLKLPDLHGVDFGCNPYHMNLHSTSRKTTLK